MPIPLILGGLAAVAGIAGIAEASEAKEKMKDAEFRNNVAEVIVKGASSKIEGARCHTSKCIVNLGQTKLDICSTSMKRFVENFRKIKNVDFRDSVGLEELRDFTPNSDNVLQLEQQSFKAADITSGGMGGIAAGTLVAVGSYSAVGFLGAASTGTAIAGLSGAAATNATLAWLGGGALGTGATAFGMTGGMVVLGGLVVGPALAVTGFYMNSKAEEALANASANIDRAKAFSEQADNIANRLKGIRLQTNQIRYILIRLDKYFEMANDALAGTLQDAGTDWRKYSVVQKKAVGGCAQLAKTIKIILDTPLLNHEGDNVSSESSRAIDVGNTALLERGQ